MELRLGRAPGSGARIPHRRRLHRRGRDTTDEPHGVPWGRRQPLRLRRRVIVLRYDGRGGVEAARDRQAAGGGVPVDDQGRRRGHGHAPEHRVRGGQAHRRAVAELRHGRHGGARRRGLLRERRRPITIR